MGASPDWPTDADVIGQLYPQSSDGTPLDDAERRRVLNALPRIAAAISTTTPRPAATTPAAPDSGAATKEN